MIIKGEDFVKVLLVFGINGDKKGKAILVTGCGGP
jgi:hypothetical protein